MAVKDEMLARKYGRIVCPSSVAALRPRQRQIHYAASKGAFVSIHGPLMCRGFRSARGLVACLPELQHPGGRSQSRLPFCHFRWFHCSAAERLVVAEWQVQSASPVHHSRNLLLFRSLPESPPNSFEPGSDFGQDYRSIAVHNLTRSKRTGIIPAHSRFLSKPALAAPSSTVQARD